MEKLKKCPCCKSKNVNVHGGNYVNFVKCEDCGLQTSGEVTVAKAIEKWNHRGQHGQIMDS